MSSVKGVGFLKASTEIAKLSGRVLNKSEGFRAIGKMVIRLHAKYYQSNGLQSRVGGGPPGEQWPGLEDSTIHQKLNPPRKQRPKTKKLIQKGTLRLSYAHRYGNDRVQIYNTETEKVHYLQDRGVGKKRKKFVVVAVNPEKQDPQIVRVAREVLNRFVWEGRK